MYNQAGMWEQAHKVGIGVAVCVFCVCPIGSAACVFCVCLIGSAMDVFCVCPIGSAVYVPLDQLCMSHAAGKVWFSLINQAGCLVTEKYVGERYFGCAVCWTDGSPCLMMCVLSPVGSYLHEVGGCVCAVCWTDGSHA